MHILKQLIKERDTIGIEINDQIIRIAYFKPSKKLINIQSNNGGELILIEEPISSEIIVNGFIVKNNLLSKKLKTIWNKEKLKNKNVILSIPENTIYSNLFKFPGSINPIKLNQAINLSIDFKLPTKKNTVYVGYENNLSSNGINEVLISAISKNITNSYIKIFNNAGINIIALESHLASISRSIKITGDDLTLIIKKNKSSTTLFCVKKNFLKFSRVIPSKYIKDKKFLISEIEKIKNFFENKYKEKIKLLVMDDAQINNLYTKYTEKKDISSEWITVIGALLRGKIEKGYDNNISLLPVGTIEAYEQQKMKIFISLIKNLTISISMFFLFSFIISYLFILSVSQKINSSVLNIPIYPVSADVLEKESDIDNINKITLAASSIVSTTTNWSILINEIKLRIIEGIIISSFNAISINDKISITGISANREVLNKFKTSLDRSNYLLNIELPITKLEQRINIPFSITFNIKDPSMLNFK